MSRWYQNVLSGKQVEVKTLEDDDFYQDNPANWARIAEPPKSDVAVAIEDMTVAELRAFAAANDIDLGEFTKKADLRELIEASLEQ